MELSLAEFLRVDVLINQLSKLCFISFKETSLLFYRYTSFRMQILFYLLWENTPLHFLLIGVTLNVFWGQHGSYEGPPEIHPVPNLIACVPRQAPLAFRVFCFLPHSCCPIESVLLIATCPSVVSTFLAKVVNQIFTLHFSIDLHAVEVPRIRYHFAVSYRSSVCKNFRASITCSINSNRKIWWNLMV